MSVSKETSEEFNVSAQYNKEWNSHYDFNNPANLAEIEQMAAFDKAFDAVYGKPFGNKADPSSPEYAAAKDFIRTLEIKALGNGDDRYKSGGAPLPKPWGSNAVLNFIAGEENDGVDVCEKEIVVFGHRQLSLQKHRGRAEIWTVAPNDDGTTGILTVSLNEKVFEVSKKGIFDITDELNGKSPRVQMQLDKDNYGQDQDGNYYIVLPAGSVHAMNNIHDIPVRVLETQTGNTWESDNDRLIEALEDKRVRRATIPLVTEAEYTAAQNFLIIERMNAPHWDNGRRWDQNNAPTNNSAVA